MQEAGGKKWGKKVEESSCNAFDPWYSMDVETKHKRETKMLDAWEESERKHEEEMEQSLHADYEVLTQDEILDRIREEMDHLTRSEIEDLADKFFSLDRKKQCFSIIRDGKVFYRLPC